MEELESSETKERRAKPVECPPELHREALAQEERTSENSDAGKC